jgi:hypothetical protein
MRHLAILATAPVLLACSAHAELMQPDVKEVEMDVAAKASAENLGVTRTTQTTQTTEDASVDGTDAEPTRRVRQTNAR